ncbi:MAG: hypothetical protein ABIV93_16300 [Byssovorax sp.]
MNIVKRSIYRGVFINMRKSILSTTAVCLMAISTGASEARAASFIPFSNSKIEYVGRWGSYTQYPDRKISFYGGSYVNTRFTGTTLKIHRPARHRNGDPLRRRPDTLAGGNCRGPDSTVASRHP